MRERTNDIIAYTLRIISALVILIFIVFDAKL